MDLENLEVSLLVLPDFSREEPPSDELYNLEPDDWTEPDHQMSRSLQMVEGHIQKRVSILTSHILYNKITLVVLLPLENH